MLLIFALLIFVHCHERSFPLLVVGNKREMCIVNYVQQIQKLEKD